MTSSENSTLGLLGIPLSLLAWLVIYFVTIVFSLAGLILLPLSIFFDRGTRRLMHRVAVGWAHAVLATSPVWAMRREGMENIIPGQPYVIVANHQSLLDIFVVLAALPLHFKFMAKKELFPIPFIGWHMALAGYIPIDRTSRESGQKAMDMARAWLGRGVSVLFFPEGTRSLNGEIQDFKMGAFKIAQECDRAILPIVIDRTGDAVPKKSWRLRKKTKFYLSVGRRVRVEDDRLESLKKLQEAVRQEMIQRLAGMREKS